MKNLFIIFCSLAYFISFAKQDKPNILWITSEDNSAHYMSFFGDKSGYTPNLDKLASEGVVYERAYSNGAVCAVARSTIITGAYASSLGTTGMRSRYPIPEKFKTYPEYLRGAGYYCTNNSKTDYNIRMDDKSIWDDCSNSAHFKNRPKGKPFFAVFNNTITHESNLFPDVIAKNRKKNTIPQTPKISPKNVILPPMYPDTVELRNDIAVYHDCINSLDGDIGEILKDLEKDGSADDTIIFYYSDHGGILPREKRYLEDTGTHVPLIVKFPKNWKHLAPKDSNGRVKDIVEFVDLAPTVLSLAGLEKPQQMEGKAFLGKYKCDSKKDYAYLYAERYDTGGIFSSRRGITNGDTRYIRNFYSFKPYVITNGYAFGQDGWKSWKKEFENKKLNKIQSAIWEKPNTSDILYDTKNDVWEVENIAIKNPILLSEMKKELYDRMKSSKDTAVLPEVYFYDISEGGNVYDFVRGKDFEYDKVLEYAWKSGDRNKSDKDIFIDAIENDKNKIVRYWSIVGLATLGKDALGSEEILKNLLKSKSETIPNKVMAALAIALITGENSEIEFLRSASSEKLFQNSNEQFTKNKKQFVKLFAVVARKTLDGDIPIKAKVERPNFSLDSEITASKRRKK